jgi:hypothetical protein
MVFFVLGFAAFLGVAFSLLLFVGWTAGWKHVWTSGILVVWATGIPFAFVPLVLAVLTYVKMMRPLKANVAPSKKWASALEILGYFFGLIACGYVLWFANSKIKKAQN